MTPPLGAAERNVDDRALPRHPGGERPHLVQGDVLVVTDAALARAARDVVEDAVADEDLDAAVVHRDRDRDLRLPHGLAQHLVEARVEAELLRGQVEPGHHFLEGAGGVDSLGRRSDGGKLRFDDLVHLGSLLARPAGRFNRMGAGL